MTILIKQYIPLRRELRVGMTEKGNGTLDMLLAIEYFVTASRPIRDSNDELEADKKGLPHGWYACARKWPAEIEPELKYKLYHLEQVCQRATDVDSCSIYDVRVDGEGEF